MNQLTPYEQLLAQEMEQLPLPASMDSTWSVIQLQLDAENTPGTKKPKPPKGGTGSHWRLLIVAGVIIGAAFLFWPHKKTSTKGILPPSPQEKISIPDSSGKIEPIQEHKNQKSKPFSTRLFKKDSPSTIKEDSPHLIPSPIIQPPAEIKFSPPAINIPQPKDSSKTHKKGRGVNLDDSDYKIISRKKEGNG